MQVAEVALPVCVRVEEAVLVEGRLPAQAVGRREVVDTAGRDRNSSIARPLKRTLSTYVHTMRVAVVPGVVAANVVFTLASSDLRGL